MLSSGGELNFGRGNKSLVREQSTGENFSRWEGGNEHIFGCLGVGWGGIPPHPPSRKKCRVRVTASEIPKAY